MSFNPVFEQTMCDIAWFTDFYSMNEIMDAHLILLMGGEL